jgi:hypothetical protein
MLVLRAEAIEENKRRLKHPTVRVSLKKVNAK